ncbi:4-hydroxy-tetrahydrodipicolinate synthase [Clostridia bacterium]|nr:4-hydroxy-tetrahydrodipicolinate synthase [Clostridia bacterium]
MSKTPVFVGSCTALITPFTSDFIDFGKLYELIDEQIEAGTNALVICGTTGEASTQSIPEHLACVERAVVHAAGRVPIIAGTGSNDTAHALMMSQNAEKSGADALLMVTPYYNKCSQTGLVRHFNYVADRVRIPIILYNVPSRTGMSFTADTYAELAKHPNINGVKEASGKLDLAREARARVGDELYLWSGNDDEILDFLALGGKGVISVASNVVPREISRICRLYLEGKINESRELFDKYLPLMKTLFIDVNPIPVKTAMNILGKAVGELRMPLCETSGENVAIIKRELANLGLLTANFPHEFAPR